MISLQKVTPPDQNSMLYRLGLAWWSDTNPCCATNSIGYYYYYCLI